MYLINCNNHHCQSVTSKGPKATIWQLCPLMMGSSHCLQGKDHNWQTKCSTCSLTRSDGDAVFKRSNRRILTNGHDTGFKRANRNGFAQQFYSLYETSPFITNRNRHQSCKLTKLIVTSTSSINENQTTLKYSWADTTHHCVVLSQIKPQ